MALYIVSTGFNVTQILYKAARTQPSSEDRFLFLMPISEKSSGVFEKREGAIKTLKYVFSILNVYSGVKYDLMDVNDEDVYGSILTLLDRTMYINGKFYPGPIEVWAVGGTRSLVSILTFYGQIDPRVKRIIGFSERSGRFIEIPTISGKHLYRMGKIRTEYNLLRNIEEGKGIPGNVSSRLVNKLIKEGLIIKTMGRKSSYEITELGMIYRRRYEILLKL